MGLGCLVYEVRGWVLPQREERSLWVDGDRLRVDPVPNADLIVTGGWVLPGLVDVHTHPGTEKPGDVFADDALRRHLISHRDAGVLLVRAPGSAARFPDWVHDDPDLPRVRTAGPWLATPGRFFPGYGRDVSEEHLVAAAVEEARASTGWCKIIGDWKPEEPAVSLGLLRSVTDAVHAIGGKVAVHCQTAEGCRNAVLAGLPFGKVASEIAWLIRAGLPAEAALGAASWVARSWLGLPGLIDGAPADLTVYPTNPVVDPAVTAHPSRVILRGRIIL